MMTPREVLRALQLGKISIEDAKRTLTAEESPMDGDTGTSQASVLDKLHIAIDRGTIRKEAIAIVGMSGRYPDARNLTEYWDNLVQGKNAIREIPLSRFNVSDYYDPNPGQRGKMYCKWLGALDEIECFDPLFFAISPAEAERMDPQQRLFLEEGYKAFEDAGYSPQLLSDIKCGVYLGIMSHEYDLLMYLHSAAEINVLGASSAIAAARIAYLLNLKGPAIPIDTACSSSLVATHLACQALKDNEIDMALVGGVSLYLVPDSYVSMCSAEMLSPDGQCKAFDASANGFVPGEGVGALVLKRLADAEADHDQIYGVIIGSGINQDGKTNGITAPSMKSQIALEREIYEKYQIDPASISYVEMHGTGTKLGDPIELEALATVFQEKTQRKQYCAIGSVKTNIGHTSAAAGVASVQKVLLSMQQKKLVPTLNFQQPNEHFDFAASPFYVNTTVQDWQAEVSAPRRAAVSSFGFSGTNAHIVIEEYISESERARSMERPSLFVLSAMSEQQLKSYAQEMKRWIQVHTELALADIALTLQLGREELDHRLAIVADTWQTLLQRLEDFVANQTSVGVYTGQVKASTDAATLFNTAEDAKFLLHAWCQKNDLAEIAQVWIKGGRIDWKLLYSVGTGLAPVRLPYRVSLPTYPFARERYWLPIGAVGTVPCACPMATGEQGPAPIPTSPIHPLHPLVQRNISDFFAIRFSSTFRGDEFFLADHVVKGQRIMPGGVYLEMARAAAALAMRIPAASAGFAGDGSIVRLSQIVWTRPLAVSASPVTVDITLSPQENRTIAFIVGGDAVPYAQGMVALNAQGTVELEVQNLDLPTIQSRCHRRISGSECYQRYHELSISYGPSMQGIERLSVGEGEVLARLRLPVASGEVRTSTEGSPPLPYVLHPSMLDAALHACIGLLIEQNEPPKLHLPFALEELLIIGTMPTQGWAWCRRRPVGLSGAGILGKETDPRRDRGFPRPSEPDPDEKPLSAPANHALAGSKDPLSLRSPKYLPLKGPVGAVPDSDPVAPDADPATGLVFDIEVCDDDGRVALRLRGFSTRMLPSVDALPNAKPLDMLGITPLESPMSGSLGSEVMFSSFLRSVVGYCTNRQDIGASTAGLLRLAPLWDPIILSQRIEIPEQAVAPELTVAPGLVPGVPTHQAVVVGGTLEEQSAIARVHPHACPLEMSIGASIERLVQRLQELETIEQVFWLAPHDPLLASSQESILAAQQQGVLACFRLIKALLQLGYGDKTLRWTVITRQARTLSIAEIGNPTHASLLGLFGSLTKEASRWHIQQVDLPTDVPLPLAEMRRLPVDSLGHGWLYRAGRWYRQILVPLDVSSFERREAYRSGGVYVVIGGAGGIGEVWSADLIRRYQAQIIWIGRRRVNAEIRAKQEQLATLGPRPRYITADATDRNALQQAYQQVKRECGQIHGVVHSAIVLQDQSLIKMDEERFQAVLAAKVDVSVRLAQVFEQEPLDFVLFFSSFNAFMRNAGQSNYAAGCTFADAFAARLGRDWPCVVKVMNWSYWGSVGVVASSEYRERMAQIGVGSIEPAEALETLEELLAGPVDQMVVLKMTEPASLVRMQGAGMAQGTTNKMGEMIRTEEIMIIYPERLPSCIRNLVDTTDQSTDSGVHREIIDAETRQAMQEMNTLLGKCLWSQLQSLGLFREKHVVLADLREQAGISVSHNRWLQESVTFLERQQYLYCYEAPGIDEHTTCTVVDPTLVESAALWYEWDRYKEHWTQHANLNAQVVLVETMLRALPAILTDKKPATEVMFPNGSMELVAGVYKHNVLADFFNEVVARQVVAYVQERLAYQRDARLRILEIGAGTGGTTSRILQMLHPYQTSIAEYCYSDISEAFLRYGQQTYGVEHPYLTYKLFNVEMPLADQGIELGSYDLVIAANVLHATSNIRRTIRNAKAALKKRGLLLLNEITGTSLFTHLTFGLLEGWWIYDDPELRIPGCPGLTAENWEAVLSSEGFGAIDHITSSEASGPALLEAGQQVIVAESDGVVRQPRCLQLGSRAGAPSDRHKTQSLRSHRHKARSSRPRTGLKPRIVAVPSNGSRKDIDPRRLPKGKVYTPNPNGSSRNAIGSVQGVGSAQGTIPTVDNRDEELRERSIAYLKEQVGKVLNLPSTRIDSAEPLTRYGLDSLLVLQLTNALRTDMEQISSTLFFEYTTIDALVEHLLNTQRETLERLVGINRASNSKGNERDKATKTRVGAVGVGGRAEEGWGPRADPGRAEEGWGLAKQRHVGGKGQAHRSQITSSRSLRSSVERSRSLQAPVVSCQPLRSPVTPSPERDIAIIGLAGRYPGARDVQAFWDLLKNGKSAISEIPAERWDWRQYFQAEKGANPGQAQGTVPTMYTKWGGFLEDIECFDAAFFHISPREAEQIDPQERLFLEVSYASIEDAGYTPAGLQEAGPVGVFVGAMNGNYPTGATYWSIANRVSFTLGLQGPSVAVDTACSSSLTALHFAVESLLSGMSASAIVGGVNLIVDPVHYVRLSRVGMLSAGNQCKSFGEDADGFVDGEGVGAILLKPLQRAEADGDHIYGVIKATAINHGGKTNGYTVPSPQAQASVIEQALRRGAIDPRTISYIEAHGTGTVLGDPIEIAGLTRAFETCAGPVAQGTQVTDHMASGWCAIGSVKSNIGHTESAAGIAGITKVLLQMRHGQLVPSLHAQALNPHIDFSVTPFVVQQELTEWQQPQVRRDANENDRDGACHRPKRAGISSFGAGGSNAHVILEEYVERRQVDTVGEAGPALIVLSTRNEERLQERVQQLLTWIQEEPARHRSEARFLRDLAYTLQIGREAMEERLAMLVGSLQELEEKLRRYSEGAHEEGDWYQGRVKRLDAIEAFATDEDGQKAIAAWMSKRKYGKLLELWVKGLTIDWRLLYSGGMGLAQESRDQYRLNTVGKGLAPVRSLPLRVHRISLPTYPFARERYWMHNERAKVSNPVGTGVSSVPIAPVSIPTPPVHIPTVLDQGHQQVALRPLTDHPDLSRDGAGQSETAISRLLSDPTIPQLGGEVDAGADEQPVMTEAEIIAPTVLAALNPARLSEKPDHHPEQEPALFTVAELEDELARSLAQALYMEQSDIDLEIPFVDMGLDSVIGVEWMQSINKQYASNLTASGVYDYPTIRQLARFLQKELVKQQQTPVPSLSIPSLEEGGAAGIYKPTGSVGTDRAGADSLPIVTAQSSSPSQAPDRSLIEVSLQEHLIPEKCINAEGTETVETRSESLTGSTLGTRSAQGTGTAQGTIPTDAVHIPVTSRRDEAIAIVGMAGKYPGASDLSAYWDNLVQGKNGIREIPPSRFDISDYYNPGPPTLGKMYSKRLGALEDIECFDPLFFHISPAEAEMMDPQQRLFLEEGYKALEDAGYSPRLLNNSKCGVYLGMTNEGYGLEKATEISPLGVSPAIAAARIAYHLNLKGPAMAIDTACSSSLVAAHLACQALRAQEIDMALVGGVSLLLTPAFYIGMCGAGMLSPDGQCKTFDASANGFVPGEGVGALVLKRLADAQADHDHIYGLIIGSGINQDGATNGITAPSVKRQMELQQEVYEKYYIDPASISYVEMHGTGTKLGDPIELEALSTVFQERTQRKQYCAIGSVKTNIGHTLAAAGMAGLQKVLLAMKYKRLVPTLNFQRPNEHFDFVASPFYVNTEVQDWPSETGMPLRAAVNSFGFSGTNSHVVVEEYIPRRDADRGKLCPDGLRPLPTSTETPILFVLSAKSEQQLVSYAQDMRRWIQAHTELALADIAFTLQLGRGAMEYRLAIEASSREMLLQRLERFVNKQASPGLYTAQVKKGSNDATLFEADEDGLALLRIWCEKKRLAKIAQVWVKGVNVDWELLYPVEAGRETHMGLVQGAESGVRTGSAQGTIPTAAPNLPYRVSLPTYPFARGRYWILNGSGQGQAAAPTSLVLGGQGRAAVPTSVVGERQGRTVAPTSVGREAARTVLLMSGWKEAKIPTHSPTAIPAQSLAQAASNPLVLLCGLPDIYASHVDAKLGSGGCCRSLSVGTDLASVQQPRRALHFQEVVVQLVQELQHLLQSRSVGGGLAPLLVQVVVAHSEEASLLEALVGVLKTAQLEYPMVRGQLIEVEGEPLEEELLAWLHENQQHPLELHIRYRGGKRWVREWQEHPEVTAPLKMPWKEGGCYLITGGAGGLGRLFVQEIARHVQKATIILVGRSVLSASQRVLLEAVCSGGIHIDYQQVDVSDGPAVHALVQRAMQESGHLDGIIHAAGVLRDSLLLNKTPEDVQAVLAPKVMGVEHLDEACREIPLDFFLLCSSLTAVTGNMGQADYAAANAYLDAFAHARAIQVLAGTRQGTTVSINWPHWEEGGMRIEAAVIQMMRERLGVEVMDTQTGMEMFYRALASGQAQVMVAHGRVERMRHLMQSSVLEPTVVIEQAQGVVPMDRLHEVLTHMVCELLKVQVEQIDAETDLSEYGLDSITFTQLANRLNQTYGLDLTPALFFECPTLSRLTQYLQATYAAVLAPHFAVASPATSGGVSQPPLQRTDIYSVILAPNPSPLTGTGTRTIVLGDQSTGAVVIDPAIDDPAYLAAIIQEGQRYGGIRRILITHGHSDHMGGASALHAQLGVPVLAFSNEHVPCADEEIADNACFPIGDDMLHALYTPGHCPDHLCFWLAKQRVLFAGDLVTSSGPALIPLPPEGDLLDYMHSLERVQNLESVEIVPAHGETILRPREMLAECITHCQKRKERILATVRGTPQGIDIQTIIQTLYKDVDASLYDFMAISVLSNLSTLEREGKVTVCENIYKCMHDGL